jgi:hypothetical protein
MFVLKRCDPAEPETIKKMLNEEKIPAKKVVPLRKGEDSVYMVVFEKNSITLKELQTQHSIVAYAKIVWDKLSERERKPTQCKRCQAWGWSQSH